MAAAIGTKWFPRFDARGREIPLITGGALPSGSEYVAALSAGTYTYKNARLDRSYKVQSKAERGVPGWQVTVYAGCGCNG